MTDFLRKLLKTPIAWVILALAFAAFAITGMGSPFGSPGPGSDTVARIGETNISGARLQEQFDRRLQLVRQEQPELTTEAAIDQGALSSTLDQLVVSTALEEFGKRIGLGASTRLVDAEIAGMSAFAGPTGRFDEQAYRAFLQRENLNEKTLKADLAGDIVRRHLLSVVNSVGPVPDGVAAPFALHQLEQRTLRVGAVPYVAFDIPEPTDEELQAFYQEQINLFTIPERRRVRYAIFDRDRIAQSVALTEDDLSDYYDENAADYAAREARSLRQVVLQDQAQAQQIAARIRSGEDFAAVAADELGFTETDLELGTFFREQLDATVSEDISEAAFAANEGGVVGPLESDFGYHVLTVDEVQRSEARPFAAVRGEIEERLRADRIEDRIADLIDQAQDLADDGASVAEIAADTGLTLQELPPVTEGMRAPGAQDFAPSETQRAIVALAYDMTDGDDPMVERVGENDYALISLEEVIAAAPQPLAEIEEQVRGVYDLNERRTLAAQKASEIVAAVRDGAEFNAALEDAGYPPAQEITARRVELSAQQGQLPAYISQGFVQRAGEVSAVPLPQQGVEVIVLTSDVVPGRLEDAPNFLQTVAAQLRTAQLNEMQFAFASAIADHVGTERFPEALANVEATYRNRDQPAF